MITIKIDGQPFHFKKEEVEKKISQNGIDKIGSEDFDGKKGMFGSLIGSAMMMMGVKKPKEAEGMDNLEFASRLVLSSVLNQLDGQTIELESSGVEVDESEKN